MEGLTASEQRIFTLGMLCATDGFSNIKVDYEMLANQANLKNGASASVLFNKTRRKILQLKAAGGDPAPAAKTPSPKKASTGDKVTKPRARKPAAKAKGKVAAENDTFIDPDETAIQGNGTSPLSPNTTMGTGAAATKGAKGKGRAAAKVKAEPNGDFIKTEPHVKNEDIEEFAEGIIEGTFYPEEGDILDDLWHIGAYPVQGFPGSPVTPNEEPFDTI